MINHVNAHERGCFRVWREVVTDRRSGGKNPREVNENTADRVKNMRLFVICKDTKRSEM